MISVGSRIVTEIHNQDIVASHTKIVLETTKGLSTLEKIPDTVTPPKFSIKLIE